MLEAVSLAPPDPILGLSEAFAKDPRPGKINLTIGVYQAEQGRTPVLQCVKRAEQLLLESEQSKTYLGIDGLASFRQQASELALGGIVPADRIAAVQTPGGTGALKVSADLLRRNFGPARIWISTPTWPNHAGIFESAGLTVHSYPYLSADKQSLDLPAMLDTLGQQARPGDILCLHGCCHNPSGIDPDAAQWEQIAQVAANQRLLPLVDLPITVSAMDWKRIGSACAIASQHPEFIGAVRTPRILGSMANAWGHAGLCASRTRPECWQ